MQSRSRLKKNQEFPAKGQNSALSGKNRQTYNSQNLSSQYIRHIPLLFLSLIFFFWCVQIITTKHPQDIANFLVFQAYLPLLIPFFLFVTFFTAYLTLNIKRGTVIGLFATLLVLFRLQQVQFPIWWTVPFLLIFAFCLKVSKKSEITHHTISSKLPQ